ncbi:Basic helix-loop-helix leucine zipper transcription factor, partial [Cynara cardunculus var. scolymus]
VVHCFSGKRSTYSIKNLFCSDSVPTYLSCFSFCLQTYMMFSRLSDYGVAEITWENGQPAMHGLGRANETLESIVHQATTCYNQSQNQEIDLQQSQSLPRSRNLSSNVASSSGKWGDSAGQSYLKKRPRSSAIFHDECVRNLGTATLQEDNISNGATINSKHNDTTMMTWPSFDSPNQSLKSKNTDDDSACQYGSENQEEECRNEGETVRSQSSRRSRAAAIHNQTERRRRERINQKMKALQKLVPNANKHMNLDMYNMAAFYRQQVNQGKSIGTSSSKSNHIRGE